MQLAIIGGTGMTGQCVVDYAVEKGHQVRVLYRTENTVPDRFKKSDKIKLVQGNVLNFDDCEKVVDGVDGVCIILGTRNKLEATTEMSTGTANLIKAMKSKNVKRFSIVMSSFLFRPVAEVPAMFHRLNDEHKRMLELTKSSDLDYIAVLPPHIADEPSSEYTVLHDEAPGRLVSKFDLAKFIVDSLEQPEHYQQVCGIAKKLD
ncbi:flavin reductase (NADPH) [Musca domestica]|uniref:Flavin reductase (NADPH) n=1 Tax=Musca domestica TaxID=7370 RepID=A0A9J7CWJ3_MUSDO|nr:flavin reductase (NADPH) [Musca domestica]